jgi:hypothetical protein
MVSPVHGDYRRCQAEIPLIILCRFPGPALYPNFLNRSPSSDRTCATVDGRKATFYRDATTAADLSVRN